QPISLAMRKHQQRTNTSPRDAPWPRAKHFMSDILNKTIVLVLNRNWQAINIRTPQDAFCQMATNVATALDIEGDEHIRHLAERVLRRANVYRLPVAVEH